MRTDDEVALWVTRRGLHEMSALKNAKPSPNKITKDVIEMKAL